MILTDKNTIINRYIRKKIAQYKQRKAEIVSSDWPIERVGAHQRIHPILMFLLRVKSKLSGLTYEFVNENRVDVKSGKTVVYAITHIGKFDYEMLVEACDIFAYPFAGDWELMYATVDDYFLRANGVLWVDTNDKEDRQNSFKFMIKALKQGIPMLIYPEAIWNLTANLPIMKIFPGAIQAAKECNVPVIPIAIEQRGKHFLLNVGEELDFSNTEERVAVQMLRDTLATLKWEIWEYLPQERRADIPNGYYEKFVQERLAECDGFTKKLVEGRMFRDKTDREILAIKRDLDRLRSGKKCVDEIYAEYKEEKSLLLTRAIPIDRI